MPRSAVIKSRRISAEVKTRRSRFISISRPSLSLLSLGERFNNQVNKLSRKDRTSEELPSPRRKYANYTDYVSKSLALENDPDADEWELLKVISFVSLTLDVCHHNFPLALVFLFGFPMTLLIFCYSNESSCLL